MSADETSDGKSGGVLAGLLAPLRLPERVLDALDELTDATRELRPIRLELTRVSEQTEPLGKLLPTLENMRGHLGTQLENVHEVILRLERIESHLDQTLGGLVDELAAMHGTIRGLGDDVASVTDRLPDPNAPGPLEKARAAITGGGD